MRHPREQINLLNPAMLSGKTNWTVQVSQRRLNNLIDKVAAVKPQQKYEPTCPYRLSKARKMDAIVTGCYDIMKDPLSSESQRAEAVRKLNKIQSYYSSICA